MKLYPKKLNSVQQLKREKSVLQYAEKHTDNPIPGIDFFSKRNKSDDDAEASAQDGLLALASGLLGKKNVLGTVFQIARPLMGLVPARVKNSVNKILFKEVLGGFLKWKALELGWRGLKRFTRSRKEKLEEQRQERKDPRVTKMGRA